MIKNSRQKLKYLENENRFWREIKTIFMTFKGLLAAKNCLRPESALLKCKVEWIVQQEYK